MNSKVKSKKYIAGIVVLLVVALFVAFFAFKSDTLASDEVFKDVDFNSLNANIDGAIIDFEREELLIKLELSDEEKTLILKVLEDSKFERVSDSYTFDYDYRVNITFNRRYEIKLDSTNKILMFIDGDGVDSDHKYYKFANDNEFFKLLEESTK